MYVLYIFFLEAGEQHSLLSLFLTLQILSLEIKKNDNTFSINR